MKYLFVKEEEYEEYRLKGNKQNRIHRFWVEIINSLESSNKKEIKSKLTDLRLKGVEGKYNITGAKPYQFITRESSKELQEALDNFAIFVEYDTDQIFRWKEDVRAFLEEKRAEFKK